MHSQEQKSIALRPFDYNAADGVPCNVSTRGRPQFSGTCQKTKRPASCTVRPPRSAVRSPKLESPRENPEGLVDSLAAMKFVVLVML